MTDDRQVPHERDVEKMEEALEPHDWVGDIVDDAVEGLMHPFTKDPAPDLRPEDLAKRDANEERDRKEEDERVNEVW